MKNKETTISKKAAHFNIKNETDKKILDYIEENNINFSALSKKLLLKHMNEEMITKEDVEKVVMEKLESALFGAALENQIRTVLMNLLQSEGGFTLELKEDNKTKEQENIIENAVSSYTNDDLAAMDFD